MVNKLQLILFGRLEIRVNGAPVEEIKSTKAQALLSYLVVTGQPHTRSSLAGLLWGGMPESHARMNLSQALTTLRRCLSDHLEITRQQVAFAQDSQAWVDAAVFQAAVPEGSLDALQEAVNLYRGELLDGFYIRDAPEFETWLLVERARLRELALGSLHSLIEHHAGQGQPGWERAIEFCQRLLIIEPWHEEVHRQLMRLLALSGKRSAALKQYEECQQFLKQDLGVEPAPATVTLYEQIQQGQFSEPPLPGKTFSAESTQEKQFDKPDPPFAHHLPALQTPLVGRLTELGEIRRLLSKPDVCLVTIMGPGGIGKTHLATAAAHEITRRDRFDDGVIFVPLVSVSDRQQFIITVADHFNLSLGSTRDPEGTLFRALQDKNHLIVLDNFEQLVLEAEVLEQILDEAPQVKFLVTSRERLKLRQEWVLDLDGLPYPHNIHEEGAADTDAVSLFTQHARRLRANFSLDENLAPVVRICQLTQGMPLALEQAASWIRVSSAADIANQIEGNINSLSTSLRNIPQRHRVLRSVFDGSWRWLSEEERNVFCQLSVFQGGFTCAAAEQVAGISPPILALLIDKSLLSRRSQPERTSRYEMHALTHKYAHERLVESGKLETRRAYESHLQYFLAFVEQAERFWDTEHERKWLLLLESERRNIHAALRWALESDKTEQLLRLNASLLPFWVYISPAAEAGDLIERSLALPWDEGSTSMTRARAKALTVAGFAATQNSDLAGAIKHFQEGLKLFSALEDQRGIAWSLRGCGFVLMIQDNLPRAQSYCEDSLNICQEFQDEWGAAWSIYDLGNIALAGGELAKANRLLGRAMIRFQSQGILFGEYRTCISMGHIRRGEGQWAQAADCYREALAIQQRTRFIQFMAQVVEGMAHIAVAIKDLKTGVQLLAAAQARRDSVEMARWVHHERDYQRSLALTSDQLPSDIWQQAWEDGYAMTEQQTVEIMLLIQAG